MPIYIYIYIYIYINLHIYRTIYHDFILLIHYFSSDFGLKIWCYLHFGVVYPAKITKVFRESVWIKSINVFYHAALNETAIHGNQKGRIFDFMMCTPGTARFSSSLLF